ncbi:NADH-quinone oxidoreductase subunit N [Nitrosococcus wardiae]|uniref:NADH-quinone oxidoreductase subunit N n=1 Tax=Nitrosococcus wardiae TaxID=1814290 RepID=A0A4P7C440_9GAMM|nr:NADH-quinone oxidoreductase subunit N [Nitrosococcus wardiae]QBQ55582.1 NADH-quinone oxidoreductase subunit N [Nitrosococcus wardiae]
MTDFIALLPWLTLTLGSLTLTLVVAFYRQHRLALVATMIPLLLCLMMIPIAAGVTPHQLPPLLIIDQYALFYTGLILVAALAVALLAYSYLQGLEDQPEEFYMLLLLATLGATILAASNHFISLFLGLEILSVSLFALLAYPRHLRPSLEAGVKYLILSGASSAVLLFGIALIYAELGTLEFGRLSALLNHGEISSNVFFLAGLAFIIGGLSFKLSWVPFHLWTPDVYQGAPAPVIAFLTTVSKGAVFALLLRFFIQVEGGNHPPLTVMFSLIALFSILVGNLLALLQNNIKRILAYSSIAHLGYLLVALVASGSLGVEAITFYWVVYFVTNLGAFGVVTVLSSPAQEKQNLEDYQGLFWRRPVLAGMFTFTLLSLAGIPLTAGFIGKFYIFTASVEAALWPLLLTLIIGSTLGLFYYLRIIIALYRLPTAEIERVYPSTLPLTGSLALALLALLLVWWGVYPGPLMQFIQTVAMTLL